MAIFYHLSTDIQHNGEFIPRIPDCRHKTQEDSVTPRISVAPSIEDCLTAIPNGGSHLDELNIQLRGYYLIYKIDTEKLGISENDMILSDVLYERDLVRDAEITNEVWITTPFIVPEEDRFLIKLISWDEEARDVVPFSIYHIADEEYEGDYVEAYETIYDNNVPCSVKIIEPIYIHEEVKEGEEVSIYFEDEEEKELVQKYIQEHYEVEITTEYMDELTFDMKKDSNLRQLFLTHKQIVNELF
jgi:TusA-related sulfurtransferase